MSTPISLPLPLMTLTSHSPWGEYIVKTASGTHYQIVLAGSKSSVTRLPARDKHDFLHADKSRELRGDDQEQHLVALHVVVGESAEFIINGFADDISTHRMTTLVKEIEKLF